MLTLEIAVGFNTASKVFPCQAHLSAHQIWPTVGSLCLRGLGTLLPFSPSLLSCPRWVFLHEKAYQVRDTAIESSVVTKVKGFGRYANRVMDVSDYVTPPQVGSPHTLPGGSVDSQALVDRRVD